MQTELLHARALQDQARRESEELGHGHAAGDDGEDRPTSMRVPNVDAHVCQHSDLLRPWLRCGFVRYRVLVILSSHW